MAQYIARSQNLNGHKKFITVIMHLEKLVALSNFNFRTPDLGESPMIPIHKLNGDLYRGRPFPWH